MSYTVDSSIVAAWYIPGEPWEAKAIRFRNEYAKGLVQLYAPTLLLYELHNTLWKAVSRGLMDVSTALTAIKAHEKASPRLIHPSVEEQRISFKIAVDQKMAFYDAAYIATAYRTKSTLVSADQSLVKAAQRHVKALYILDLA